MTGNKLKLSRVRAVSALIFLVLSVLGLSFHTGWGTLSAFGYEAISAVCPLGALEAMIASAAFLPHALLGLFAFLIFSALFGRAFCGWICPIPLLRRLFGRPDATETHALSPTPQSSPTVVRLATQTADVWPDQAAHKPMHRTEPHCPAAAPAPARATSESPASHLDESTPILVLGGALASSAAFGFPVFCLICPVGITFALVAALWRLTAFNETSWSIVYFIGVLGVELIVVRRWCRQFCPLGALFSLMSRFNKTLRPAVDSASCMHAAYGIDCKVCAQSCPEGIDLKHSPSPAKLARCVKCHACAESCPAHAISFPFFSRRGRKESAAASTEEKSQARTDPAPLPTAGVAAPAHAPDWDVTQLLAESARCLRCGACVEACPQHNPIDQWMTHLANGRVRAAGESMLRAGSLPEICGRICPHGRLCESVCPLAEHGGAIPIGRIESAIADRLLASGWAPRRKRANGQAIAVIGAGPSGLACAEALAQDGFAVTVFEREAEIGGLLSHGIPAFKLDKALICRRRALAERLGIRFELGRAIDGADAPGVLAQFKAIYLATGSTEPVRLALPHADAPGMLEALAYLRAANPQAGRATDAPDPTLSLARKHVLVLGGGDTAMDCVRTALAQGAASVTCVARRAKEALRASPRDIELASQEGAQWQCGVVPTQIFLDAAGKVRGLEVKAHAENSPPRVLAADAIIVAFGFVARVPPWLTALGARPDGSGRLVAGDTPQHIAPKVFAGGDLTRGPDLVVTAVADGRAAAAAIKTFVRGTSRH